MKIFKNLLGYKEKNLEKIAVNREEYLTEKDFSPLYILGQSFGAGIDEKSYNHLLAEDVLNAKEYFGSNLPAIVQSEIGKCLENLGLSDESVYYTGECYESGEKSLVVSKIDTKGVLTESKKILDKLKLPHDSALFIAHPYHMERVLYTANKLGISGKPFIRKNIKFPKKDPQPWVRSPMFFVPREIIARIITK